jgi:hypothetical protein
LVAEASAAAALLLAAVALAVFGPSARSFSIWPLAARLLAYLAAGRMRFQVGSAWTPPTQLVFGADAVRASNAVRAPHRRLVLRAPGIWRAPDADASAARVGDSFYSLGPALALVLVGGQVFFMGRVASVPARPSWPRSSSTPPQG